MVRRIGAFVVVGAVLVAAYFLILHFKAEILALPAGGLHAGGVNMAKFNQIRPGMTVDQVRAIIGSDGAIEGDKQDGAVHIVMYGWPGDGEIGAHVNLFFQDGRLTEKVQFGLK